MGAYLIRRSVGIVVTFLIIITLVFFLFRIVPGDPASFIMSPKFSAEDRARLRKSFGLNKSLVQQYVIYIKNVFTLDFGNSLISGRPVLNVISERIPATLILFLPANLLAYLLGKKVGEWMAWTRGTLREKLVTLGSIASYTVFFPWLALMLIFIFSYHLELFPLGGMISTELWLEGNPPWWRQILDIMWHLCLPLTTLTLVRFAGPALVMRSSMIENLRTDFVRTARSKGLCEKVVKYHAARNSMLPLTTSFMLSFAYVISGSVLLETVFNWPGLGQLIVQSTIKLDYPVVQFTFLILAVGVLVMNLVADLAYSFLDPRVELE